MTNSSTVMTPKNQKPAKRRAGALALGAVLAASVALTGCAVPAQAAPSAGDAQAAVKDAMAKALAARSAAAPAPTTPAQTPAAEAPVEAPAAEAPAEAPVEAPAEDSGVVLTEPEVVPAEETAAPAEDTVAVAPQASTAESKAAREALTLGSYQPGTSNTGVIAGTTLTKYNTGGADLIITKDGTVLENMEIYGDIKIRAKNVVIRNSLLRGGKGAPKTETGVVDVNSGNAYNFLIEDSTILPDRPHAFRDGIVGHEFTAKRNEISRTTDGLGIFNKPGGSVKANVTAEGNYIHTLTYFDNDPNHSDGTHNDGIQVQGGENIRITGNNVVANAVAGAGSSDGPRTPHAGIGIMLQQNVAKLANVVVDKNWVDDGQTSINIDHGKKYSNITVTVKENKLGRNQLKYSATSQYPIRIIKRSASTVNGLNTNMWADNGVLLTEGKTTGIRYNS